MQGPHLGAILQLRNDCATQGPCTRSHHWHFQSGPFLSQTPEVPFNDWGWSLMWRRQWQLTPVLLPGKPHGWRRLVGCSPWGREELDWATSLSLFTFMRWRRKWQTHSSVLAWRIPGTGEPGGLPSMGSHRVGHNWSDLAVAAAESISSS